MNESEIYLGNDIIEDTPWDATNLQSPYRQLLPREDYIPASGPPVKADQVVVNIEAKEASMDGFIMTSSPLLLTTHSDWSAPITQPY